jgi:tetratricopeptide (TPR) repeat protein
MALLAEPEKNRLSAKLAGAAELLNTDPEAAATNASEVLDIYPGQPQALLLLISGLKLMGAKDGERSLLEWMAQEYPNLAAIRYELGLLFGRLGMPDNAIEHLSHAVALEPNHPGAWRALGHQLALKGESGKAKSAYVQHLRLSLKELKLLEDATVAGGDEGKAENILRQAVDISPTDVFTSRTLGELELRIGRLRDAEVALRRALDLAPSCSVSRYAYCTALTQLMDWRGANTHLHILLGIHPGDPHLESLLIGNLAMLGEREEARQLLEKMHPEASNDRIVWYNYGLGARTVGMDTQVAIDAFRKCLELDPAYGTAWWGLADLKTYRFSADEISTLRSQLKRTDIPDGLRCHLEFALGSALEREAVYAESFDHYRKGNELRRPQVSYNSDSMHADMMRAKSVFTPGFFSARASTGSPAPDPIFIVGMPRAGSTLIEQILASHSEVEGTMELPDLGDMVNGLLRRHPDKKYPDFLKDFADAELRKLGEEYLERTRYQRKLGRRFFTDKAGVNFLHVGLIQLILPHARIIDARRHPLACAFSCYKQAFAPGALLMTYDQTEIARYYRDYVEVMAHYDTVLPGRVHRVIHEDLVRDPEPEIRRLLAYCGLPFEESCLRSHETDRSVRTSSSQQVRQPIRKKAVDDWEHYDAWLQPMKDTLGPVLANYPAVPNFG